MSTAPDKLRRARRQPPPAAVSLVLTVILIALMAWFRLVVYDTQKQPFPLSPGVPLLICLWTRDRRSLYAMAVAFTITGLARIFWVTKGETTPGYEMTLIVSQFTNIWIVAGVIHGILAARDRIERKNDELAQLGVELESSNDELAASNQELAAREEEISRQNEELQGQTEELEQQSEELRRQAEELAQQSAELNDANQELLRRERGLQTLLDSGRWLRGDLSEALVMNGICQAGVQVLGESVHAAAVLLEKEAKLTLNGSFGFGLNGAVTPDFPFVQSFTALLMESGKTASIEDISVRPDIHLPRPGAGPPFRSVLGSPIWHEGKPVAALEIYSTHPHQWSEHDFRIAEWLAGQAALAIQAIRFQQEIEQKRRAAEEASVQKTRFLAAISHDVRTPANAISLLAELIGKCAQDPTRAHQVPKLAASLWHNSRAMIDLVSDVLDLSRFDSGRLDLDVSEFSLAEVIRSEIEQVRPLAQERSLTLRDVLPETDLRLSSDRTKLARVLGNFLSNAVKFTETGEIRVELMPEDAGAWAVRVIDSGIGIPSEHIGSIFDEFFQLRNPERNRDKGTGLGLAICRRLIDALGFEVDVKSVVGIGTTFTIRIPAACVMMDVPVAAKPAVNGSEYPLQGASILLVEDHEVARDTTAKLLESEGAKVKTAETGREAIRMLAAGDYEILLLDLNLPDFEGTEILRSLQVAKPAALRCILVVTGDVRPERIEEVKALGANDLLPKPVNMERLRKALAGC